jgi:hypothetical protein
LAIRKESNEPATARSGRMINGHFALRNQTEAPRRNCADHRNMGLREGNSEPSFKELSGFILRSGRKGDI